MEGNRDKDARTLKTGEGFQCRLSRFQSIQCFVLRGVTLKKNESRGADIEKREGNGGGSGSTAFNGSWGRKKFQKSL